MILSQPSAPPVLRQASPAIVRVAATGPRAAVLNPRLPSSAEDGRVRARGLDWSWAIVLIVLGAVCYNAALAFLNARGLIMQRSDVALAEIALLFTGGLIIVACGPRQGDAAPAALGTFFVLNALIVSMVNNTIFVDMARNVGIIAVFMLLGLRASSRAVDRTFLIAALLVLCALLLEMIYVDTYVRLFQPAQYFFQTRGIGEFSLDKSGLFRNSLMVQNRFSFLSLSDHRTSSLFLEQVSLANFSTIVVMYLVIRWQALSRWTRFFFIALTILILLSNDTRTGTTLALLAPLVYWLAPRSKRWVPLMCMPAALSAALAVVLLTPHAQGDNLAGRLHTTITTLGAMPISSILGATGPLAPKFADSGYTYVTYASSIFGMVALWLFAALILPAANATQKRCALMLNLFLSANLLIGGTAVFTIKVAALMWLLVGFCLREKDETAEPAAMAHRFGLARTP